MNEVLITNYTSDTTDTTDVPIYVQNDALLMHEKSMEFVLKWPRFDGEGVALADAAVSADLFLIDFWLIF